MNKGLFIHLMLTLLVITAWLFIMSGEDWTIGYRLGLVFTILVANLFAFIGMIPMQYSDGNGPYYEKIKL